MAVPSNPDFSLKEDVFPLPVKPQVGSCQGTWRRCTCLVVFISAVTAVITTAMVMGMPLTFLVDAAPVSTPAPVPEGTSVTASLVLQVDDAPAFARDERVKSPIAAAMASQLRGVSAEMVRIDGIELVAARRLATAVSLRGARRLQLMAIRVPFTILTGSVDAATEVTASLQALKPEMLTSAITEEMRSAQLEYNARVTRLEHAAKDLVPHDVAEDKAPQRGHDLPQGTAGERQDDRKPPHSEGEGNGDFILHDAWYNRSWFMSNGTRHENLSHGEKDGHGDEEKPPHDREGKDGEDKPMHGRDGEEPSRGHGNEGGRGDEEKPLHDREGKDGEDKPMHGRDGEEPSRGHGNEGGRGDEEKPLHDREDQDGKDKPMHGHDDEESSRGPGDEAGGHGDEEKPLQHREGEGGEDKQPPRGREHEGDEDKEPPRGQEHEGDEDKEPSRRHQGRESHEGPQDQQGRSQRRGGR